MDEAATVRLLAALIAWRRGIDSVPFPDLSGCARFPSEVPGAAGVEVRG